MKRTALVKAFGAAALLVVLSFAWSNARAAREAERARTAAMQKRNVLGADAQSASERLEFAEKKRGEIQATLDLLQKKKTAKPSANSAAAMNRSVRRLSIRERLEKEPAFQILWLADRRAALARSYGPLVQKLRLSSSQVQKFQEAAIRRDEQNMDINAIAERSGIFPTDPTVVKLRAEAETKYNAEQREALGDEGYRQLQDFERVKAVWEMVDGIAGGAVAIGHEPLSADQAEQLVETIAQTSSSYRNGGPVSSNEIDWEVVDAQARLILTPTQYVLYITQEPSLPQGGRFQNRLYSAIEKANASERAASKSATTAPSSN
jgi:hypothetical protein